MLSVLLAELGLPLLPLLFPLLLLLCPLLPLPLPLEDEVHVGQLHVPLLGEMLLVGQSKCVIIQTTTL